LCSPRAMRSRQLEQKLPSTESRPYWHDRSQLATEPTPSETTKASHFGEMGGLISAANARQATCASTDWRRSYFCWLRAVACSSFVLYGGSKATNSVSQALPSSPSFRGPKINNGTARVMNNSGTPNFPNMACAPCVNLRAHATTFLLRCRSKRASPDGLARSPARSAESSVRRAAVNYFCWTDSRYFVRFSNRT
jgi:hypothetical protein